jgi:hypothetical protein
MNRFDKTEDPRRRLLIQALAAGLFSAGLPGGRAQAAMPSKLPSGAIYSLSGEALVNGKAATAATRIGANDTVETTKGGKIVFVVGENAMIQRSDTRVVLQATQGDSMLLSGLRLITGALLCVFAREEPKRIMTATASIEIRGTGVYMESNPEQTYFCTCYGVAEITANNDRESKVTVSSKHHDRPLYIVAGAGSGKSISDAPFVNHTDQELMLIETLVGRTPPFVFPADAYTSPRRSRGGGYP